MKAAAIRMAMGVAAVVVAVTLVQNVSGQSAPSGSVSSAALRALSDRVAVLTARLDVLTLQLADHLNGGDPPSPTQIDLLPFGWVGQDSDQEPIPVRREDGQLLLDADLRGGDDYAELFLDLTGALLRGVDANVGGPFRTYDLVGKTLVATVYADSDFSGDPRHPNGAQFLVSNSEWDNWYTTFINAGNMHTATGTEVFLELSEHPINRSARALKLKFTIGSHSRSGFRGTFRVGRIVLQ
jgi:hypothetical protein